MESNFIKERVVVREELIKKNLKSYKKDPQELKPSTSTENAAQPSDKIIAFEEVINEGLKHELVVISQRVDIICRTIADYLKVKAALKVFKINSRDVRVQTNIGCNFYAQCLIDDASKVYICVGNDYYLHMELSEAIKMIEFKEKQLTKELDSLQEKASKIKAYIKVALEAMGMMLGQ